MSKRKLVPATPEFLQGKHGNEAGKGSASRALPFFLTGMMFAAALACLSTHFFSFVDAIKWDDVGGYFNWMTGPLVATVFPLVVEKWKNGKSGGDGQGN